MSEYTPTLHRLARLARERHTLLAGLLAIYQDQESLNEAELAAFLKGDASALLRLALCRRPRTDPVNFRPDVERIATYANVNATQLAKLIRAAAACEERHRVVGSTTQILLAARDRDEADESDESQNSTDVRPSTR
jgi:hypothetical protein